MEAGNFESRKTTRKNTNTADNAPFFKSVFDQSSDAILITDLKGTIVMCNPSAAKLFNSDTDYLTGRCISTLSFEKNIITDDLIDKLCDESSEGRLTLEEIFVSGGIFFKGLVRITLLNSPDNSQKLLIVIHDITAESHLKAELTANREQLQNILDFISSMIIVTNGTHVRNCNRNLLRFFDAASIEEFNLKNRNISDFFVPLSGYLSETKKGHWLKIVLRNKGAGADTKVVLKDRKSGALRYFLVDIRHFPGEKHYYIVSFTDITELEHQKKDLEDTKLSLEEKVSLRNRELFESYRKLAANEEMLSVIFNIVNAGIVMIDEKGRIVRVNSRFCEMYEMAENSLLGKDFSESMDESINEEAQDIFNRLKANLIKDISREWKIVTQKGKTIDVIISARWVTMYDGKRYLVCTHHDVSEKNRLEKKQREQERMLVQQSKMAAMGEMIGAIAHQWKQPLNAIALITQNIKDDFECSELTEQSIGYHVKEVLGQVSFMAATIDDFRNFFKPSKGKMVFNASEAVAEIVNLMLPQLKVNYIVVYLDNSGSKLCGANVKGYPNEFKQVALNLITNSKEAITERRAKRNLNNADAGTINIRTESTESHVKITFTDNGGGIPENVLPRMFEPYFSTKDTGTGIGLYMCRTIIEGKMKGKISVRNIAEGAEFTVLLEKSTNGGNIEKLAGS